MARGYSRDLRERLLQAVASGLSKSEVAARTGVSLRTLQRWQRTQQQGGTLERGRPTGGPRKIPRADEPALRDAGGGDAGCDPGGALCRLGGGRVRAGEHGDDEPGLAPRQPPVFEKRP